MVYETRRLDHLGIVAGICDRISLVEKIDALIPLGARKVSVGEAVKAMIMNALGFASRPLYLSPEFFSNKPIDLLFRPDLQASDFNDDSLGRALDALFEHEITTIFAQVASQAVETFDIPHRFFHLDTTSFSFDGEYPIEEQQEGNPLPIKICRGYSKDHRPELKQAVLSLISAHKSTLPLWLETLDGNSSDKKSFPLSIKSFLSQLESSTTPCFIVDSALFSAKNIQSLHASSIDWLTRVPETSKEARKLIENTDENSYVETSMEGYSICEKVSSYGDVQQRWILVSSVKGRNREINNFAKRLEKAQGKAKIYHFKCSIHQRKGRRRTRFCLVPLFFSYQT